MPSPRSVVQSLVVDVAEKKHYCSNNKRHIISRGEKRLKIKVGRSYQTYCVACGKKFIGNGLEALNVTLSQLD